MGGRDVNGRIREYRVVRAEETLVGFNVEETEWGRFVAKTVDQLVGALRAAGVTTVQRADDEYLFFEEEELFRALGVEPGKNRDACRRKAPECLELRPEHDDAGAVRTFWGLADVALSGLFCAGNGIIQEEDPAAPA